MGLGILGLGLSWECFLLLTPLGQPGEGLQQTLQALARSRCKNRRFYFGYGLGLMPSDRLARPWIPTAESPVLKITSEGGQGFVSANHGWVDRERGLWSPPSPWAMQSPEQGRRRQAGGPGSCSSTGGQQWVGGVGCFLAPPGQSGLRLHGARRGIYGRIQSHTCIRRTSLLGRAGEPSQAKVGVHACALHVHGVHCRVTAGGGTC